MADEQKPKLRLEIAHVLFLDIIGYSKLLIDEQGEALEELNSVVRNSETVRAAEAASALVRLPTGDGMALVFTGSAECPVECAIDISQALRAKPGLPVRMGIHSGPVQLVQDVNGRENIAGAGINVAQRVMDCADAGHILLSKRAADDLAQYRRWQPYLHELGECEVKHGALVSIVNFYNDEAGNSAIPAKFVPSPAPARPAQSSRWRLRAAIVALFVIGVLIAALLFLPGFLRSQKPSHATAAALPVARALPAKSIAVLPFENLSRDPENAYFADGIQEEILTRLAKVADLKVISRTSTARYKSTPTNLPEIARQLDVAHVLEGSVQRAGDQVRVSVQLINAGTDSHLWADTFDRRLNDIFAVETEIATRISETLQAKLSGAEHSAITARPTENMEAYESYLKGRYLFAKRTHDDTLTSIASYKDALSKDPGYALAYAGLAESYAYLPLYSRVAAKTVYADAKSAAEKAVAIDDNLAEAHASLAFVLSALDLNFAGSEREFLRAIDLNPNDAAAHYLYASSVLAPLGKLGAAIAELKRAIALDPLSLPVRNSLGASYTFARRYNEAIEVAQKVTELNPAYAQAQDRLGIAIGLSGDLDRAIAAFDNSFQQSGGDFHCRLYQAHFYGVKGQRDQALQTIELARQLERAKGAEWAYGYAVAYAGIGDKEQAMQWLERSYESQEFLQVGYLNVDPLLASLHGQPRFEALVHKIIPGK